MRESHTRSTDIPEILSIPVHPTSPKALNILRLRPFTFGSLANIRR